MNLSIVTTAMLVNTRLLARTGPRPLIPTGMVLDVISMLLLTGIGVDSGYAQPRAAVADPARASASA